MIAMPQTSALLDRPPPQPSDLWTGQQPLPLFRSFWMGGFETSSHINRAGDRVDMIAATQHDWSAEHDYALLASVGMRAARDAPRWHLIDHAGRYDFASFTAQVQAAARSRTQTLWDICHYGWPDDIDIFTSAFVDRFTRFCRATARFISDYIPDAPFYVPINEISFLAHAVGEVGFVDPVVPGRGLELKRQLVRTAISGMQAILDVDPRARFVHVDPVVNVLAPRDRPDLTEQARSMDEWQFQAWDMLCGRLCPELGGHPRYLDIVGVNFYHDGQWEMEGEPLHWAQSPRDTRWLPLHRQLERVWSRYQRPLFVSETSHFGVGRAHWLREIVSEVQTALEAGVPVGGVCLYPILDRPDWNISDHWHNAGLWDLLPETDGRLARIIKHDYADELRIAQHQLGF